MARVPIVYSAEEELGLADTLRGSIEEMMPDHSFVLVSNDAQPDAEVWIKLEATSQMGNKTGDFVRLSVFYHQNETNAGNVHGPRSLFEDSGRVHEWATFASQLVERGLRPDLLPSNNVHVAFTAEMEELANFIRWLNKAPKKVGRSLRDLAQRLEEHTSLLIEYIEKVRKDGDRRYLGEIAAKLRLLVIGGRSRNTPLLLGLAEATGHDLKFTVDGPPGFVWSEGVIGGEPAHLTSYLQGIAFMSGGITLTNEEVIKFWSQQHGSAHEDWDVDRRLLALTENPVKLGGDSTAEKTLLSIATIVANVATQYLDGLTFEALDAAEHTRSD